MQRRSLLMTVAAAGAAQAERPRLGFALGSGALHGWAHIGIVRACARLGLTPDVIAGTSAGAAVGALWAGGLPVPDMTRIARGLDWGTVGRWVWSTRGLKRNDSLRLAIDRVLGHRVIEDLPIRFCAVASDAATGESVVLDRGPVGLAVAASSAVPVWFEPVRIGSRELLDGNLTAPVPVDAARALGASVLVAVDVLYRPHEERPSSITDLAFQSMHILGNALAREQTQRADFTLRLDLHHLMRDRLDPDLLIDAGEAALLELAPRLRARLA